MINVSLILLYLCYTYGYHIKGQGVIPINRQNALQMIEYIIQELKGEDNVARVSQSIYDVFENTGMNVVKVSNNNESNYLRADETFVSNNETALYEYNNITQEFINILLQFGHISLDKAWNSRPNLKAFKTDDLLGEPNDKAMFLAHLKRTRTLYKSTIDNCEAQQFKRYDRTIPNHLIVTDLISMAEGYNVTLIRNKGTPFYIYNSGNILENSLKFDDLVGSSEDKRRFLTRVKDFSTDAFKEAFNYISHYTYGIPVPDHIYTEWVIAVAKNFNVEIKSYKGEEFNMNWQTGPRFIGYPGGSYGGIDHVTALCLKTKKKKVRIDITN